jgi:hypothetical protein
MGMDLVICHDTEDVYTPAEAGMDEVPKRLAEIYTEEGIPAHFMVIGDRARLLKERGREDVIAAMRRHSIGVHTLHDAQPYDAVEAASREWDEALAIVREMQREAYRAVAESFDCEPVCLSAHALNSAPQMNIVARELGLPFLYGYAAAPPLYNVSRYCGTLNFPYFTRQLPVPAPYFEGFDDALSCEPEFEAHLERFERHVQACLSVGQPLLLLHPCHPFKIYSLDWVDFYLSPNGVLIPPDEWPKRPGPGRRSRGEVELALQNFRRLVRYIKRHPQLNPITIPEAVRKYGSVPRKIDWLALMAGAQRVCAERQVSVGGQFSPAELVLGWAQSLLTFAHEGQLPRYVERHNDCLGPVEDPLITPEEPGKINSHALVALGDALLSHAREKGHLPANVALPGGRLVGLGSLHYALAQAYLAVSREGQLPDAVVLERFPRQPEIGLEIGRQYADLAESVLVRPNLDVGRLYRWGKLQAWTLAPAWCGA